MDGKRHDVARIVWRSESARLQQPAILGKLPDGQSLSGKVVDPEKRRAATDFTFSAPKSVSIAALVQQDGQVMESHHQAVVKALSVLEERYAQTRISTSEGRPESLLLEILQRRYLPIPPVGRQSRSSTATVW